jgi:hypothetical protein
MTWLTGILLGALGADAQTPLLMEQSREVEMALSSAPEDLRAGAGMYVLQSKGFVKVRDSRNGFNCGGAAIRPFSAQVL